MNSAEPANLRLLQFLGRALVCACGLLFLAACGSQRAELDDDLVIAGSLHVAGTKNFRIDHPLDPENRVLLHFASEGPEPFNVYAGRVRLDADGLAWVELPEWFELINTDFRYQLTALGEPGPGLHVAREIQRNRFLVAGGAASGEVSWEVRARRNDLTIRRLDPQVEMDKPTHQRGSFIDPVVWQK